MKNFTKTICLAAVLCACFAATQAGAAAPLNQDVCYRSCGGWHHGGPRDGYGCGGYRRDGEQGGYGYGCPADGAGCDGRYDDRR